MVIFYFSGTGNTKYVATALAEKLNSSLFSIEKDFDFIELLRKNERIAFCFPIYGSCPPKIMRNFVRKYKEQLQNKKMLLFCTQAMGSGDGARSLMDELQDISCEVIYADHFIMPNNICNIPFPVFPMKWYPRLVERKAQKIHDNLENEKYIRKGFHPLSILIGKSQRVVFQKAEKEYAGSVKIEDTCVGCQQCVKQCPMNNFYIEDGKVKVRNQCMLCYRCINLCPQKAITVWIKSRVKKQYHGPAFGERKM